MQIIGKKMIGFCILMFVSLLQCDRPYWWWSSNGYISLAETLLKNP